MGALFFLSIFLYNMYHTSGQNIQILGYLGFIKFFRNCAIMVFMTNPIEIDKQCCAECTCVDLHKSKPAPTEE